MQVTWQGPVTEWHLLLGRGEQTLAKPSSSLKESCQLAGAAPALGGFGRQQGELWLLKNRLKWQQLAA